MINNAYRFLCAAALAGLIAGTAAIVPGVGDRVSASTPIHSGKGDRLDLRPLGTRCSQQAWPYFEAGCVRDRRMALGRARAARIISVDRLDPPAGR